VASILFQEIAMSLLFATEPLNTVQARVDSIGYLALTYVGKRLPLQVCHNAAGHYIGTTDAGGPVSRESVEYFRSFQAADRALATDQWQQRVHP
jgi:hypothetical protein